MSGYIIGPGDTLSGIARRHGVSQKALLQANPQIANPNLIRAGAMMTLPAGDAVPSPDTVKAAIAQGKAAGGSKDATCTEAVRPCDKNASALKPAEEDLSGETEAEVLTLDQRSPEYDALEKKISYATNGMTIAEVQKGYLERTGETVSVNTLNALFTDPYDAREILMEDQSLNVDLREVLNSRVPKNVKDLNLDDWEQYDDSKNAFHDPENTIKFVSKKGKHMEAIYNKTDDSLVDSGIYRGTFNFFGGVNGHNLADIDPFWASADGIEWKKRYLGQKGLLEKGGWQESKNQFKVSGLDALSGLSRGVKATGDGIGGAYDWGAEKANQGAGAFKGTGGAATDYIRNLWR